MTSPGPPRHLSQRTVGDTTIVHYRRGRDVAAHEDRVLVAERPLAIQIVDGERYTVMRTPGHEADLAVGFLFAEAVIESPAEVSGLRACPGGDTIQVTLTERERTPVQRNLVVSSSCGLCGRDDVDALTQSLDAVGPGPFVAVEALFELPARVREQQPVHDATGSCHCAALFDASGVVRAVREDIGRHSALDKVIGHALRTSLPLEPLGVFLSGRTSLEMVIKAARAGIGLIVAVSGPSEEAVATAQHVSMTVCGFARGSELAIYSHPERIVGPASRVRPKTA